MTNRQQLAARQADDEQQKAVNPVDVRPDVGDDLACVNSKVFVEGCESLPKRLDYVIHGANQIL
jgi:hypothetical protein